MTLERKGFWLSSGICVILSAYLLYCKSLEAIAREYSCKYVIKEWDLIALMICDSGELGGYEIVYKRIGILLT